MKKQQSIYIFHKQGAESHYIGLEHLLKKNNTNLKYREFSILSNLFKTLKTGNLKKFSKQFVNIAFLIHLLFSRNEKVILGIAPYDYKLGILLKALKNHRIYYHTSWTCWDKSYHPKKKKNTPQVYKTWKEFLERRTEHIFCVTEKTRNELLENYQIEKSKTSVVYHALNPVFLEHSQQKKTQLSFIYYGRMVARKGVEELVSFFAENKGANLTLIGTGKQKPLVEKYTKENENITYFTQISNTRELKRILGSHQYMILNSKEEELFGLVIIESMSQGVIPIVAAHTGPKEILSTDTGILFNEGELSKVLSNILTYQFYEPELVANGIEKSRLYSPDNIAKKWHKILS